MKMYCQSPGCDFSFDDNPTMSGIWHCPKCGGVTFARQPAVSSDAFQPMDSMAVAATGLINRSRQNTEAEKEVLRRAGFPR